MICKVDLNKAIKKNLKKKKTIFSPPHPPSFHWYHDICISFHLPCSWIIFCIHCFLQYRVSVFLPFHSLPPTSMCENWSLVVSSSLIIWEWQEDQETEKRQGLKQEHQEKKPYCNK